MQSGIPSQQIPKKSKTKIIGIIVAVVVVILVAIIIIPPILNNGGSGGSGGSTGTPQSDTLLSSGTVQSLNAGQYYYINFTVPSGATSISLSGSYTSNNHVEVGVLTNTQFGAFTQNPSTITSAKWYSGNNDGATIRFTPSSGASYSLVIYDGNILTSDTVTIDNTVVLDYTT